MAAARLLVGIALLLAGAPPACAQDAGGGPPPRLGLPLACTPGVDCWIAQYVDHDPAAGAARDYACGSLTYDGHGGTDFAVRDLLAVVEGVPVIAAAAGEVEAVRDGMPDVSVETVGAAAVDGRECGNGVRIDHGGGLTAQYCHLREGSVRVAAGDRVEAGQTLGELGLSGKASFAHLEFLVRHRGREVDPFVGVAGGDAGAAGCGVGARPLWRDDALAALLPYAPLVLTDAGFAPSVPEEDEVRAGLHRGDSLPRTSPALMLWVEMYGARAGDSVLLRIEDPDGETVMDGRLDVREDQARWFGYGGKRRPGIAWPPGRYRGEVVVERDAAEGDGGRRRFAVARTVEVR